MPAPDLRAILPQPPETLKQVSRELVERLHARIATEGPVSFSGYMEAVLYTPGLGYYSAGLVKFGPEGDFVTAPELGPVFARCLARQAAEIGAALGDSWELLELGPGSGRLARDLLAALGEAGAPRRYRLLERSADLRALQARTLSDLPAALHARVDWLDAPPAETWQGLLLANEVVDALPVERFELGGDGRIDQLRVTAAGEGFDWVAVPAPAWLDAAVRAALAGRLAGLGPGYRSEFLPHLPQWLRSVSGSLQRGVVLVADYGHPRAAYYAADRRDGTLSCHYRHRAHADPFVWPGLTDLTAWVDFTALAEAGAETGLTLLGYAPQGAFLVGCGLEEEGDELARLPDRARLERAREIRTLTLPGGMGEAFQVMALGRGFDHPLRGFRDAGWSDRL